MLVKTNKFLLKRLICINTTPRVKGSSDENINTDQSMYEPALFIAKNGIISHITKDTIKLLSLSINTDS